jgi:hypothetical protein
MPSPILSSRAILAIVVVTGLLTPTFILLAALVFTGHGPAEIVTELSAAITREKLNLGAITLLGMAPFLLLTVVLFLYLRKSDAYRGLFLLVGGLTGLLFVYVPMHLSYWPAHFRSGGNLGFPHGLEFVIAPIFGIPAMGVGVALGWFLSKKLAPQNS